MYFPLNPTLRTSKTRRRVRVDYDSNVLPIKERALSKKWGRERPSYSTWRRRASKAEHDHSTLLLEDIYYGKEGLEMASMLNRGLPCIARHLRPAFGTQLSTDDLSSRTFRILISSPVTLLAVIVSARKKEVRVYRPIAQNLDLSK